MGFRENLKAELSYRDMLVKELADLAGISKRTIDNYLRENGSIPSADNAVRIASVLGVSAEYLVTGCENHRKQTFYSLPPETRSLLQTLEVLETGDRKIVINLIKSLKERKNG
ncbi:MAG: helix-turn-helix domain-containing protein [Spirochaetales bacterium]|jgi:transcriptional regulator with XRE-family HTH domain|nr:helix-turn-helix domain-containing protein [Spirochaetales bacterium]